MINLFVTYRCNLACPYCFARELHESHPGDMTPEDFVRLLQWMSRAQVPAAAFIGGEPTLHPDLVEMVERTAQAGVSPVLFTNGLFDTALAEQLVPMVANFVVNANDPSIYTEAQKAQLDATLTKLTELGAHLTFSKNFSSRFCDYQHLLDACERYGVTSVRYDISRPSQGGGNDHFVLDDTGRIMSHIVGFVKACEARGIRTGLDCSVRLCDLKGEDRSYLERVSMKFTGICHPSIDIHPDLSASYCLPMHGMSVPDVTEFSDHTALMWHLAEMVRPVRKQGVLPECLDCKDFMRRCQGGCMALRQAAAAQNDTTCPHCQQNDTPETDPS